MISVGWPSEACSIPVWIEILRVRNPSAMKRSGCLRTEGAVEKEKN